MLTTTHIEKVGVSKGEAAAQQATTILAPNSATNHYYKVAWRL